MVPSSVLAVSTDYERLACGGFSYSKTIHFGSPEFITDRFGGLSLSPMGSDSDAAIMGSIRSGQPPPQRAMIGDSAEEFHMVSSGEEGSSPPLQEGTTQGLRLLPS
jgi:hypothetical protein